MLGFDCGGQQWVLEVAFPTGTLKYALSTRLHSDPCTQHAALRILHSVLCTATLHSITYLHQLRPPALFCCAFLSLPLHSVLCTQYSALIAPNTHVW